MFKTVHTVTKNDVSYEYPCFKSATRIGGKYLSIRRTYGLKRTEEEAKRLVLEWEQKTLKRNTKNALIN